jgi:hypothetical protein
MVVADTFEAAREAAFKVEISYRIEQAMSVFDIEGVETCTVSGIKTSHVDLSPARQRLYPLRMSVLMWNMRR